MNIAHQVLFFFFVQISLLIPGYVLIRHLRILRKHTGIELAFGYLLSILFFALLAVASYALKLPPAFMQWIFWFVLTLFGILFIYKGYYKQLFKERFPLISLCVMTLLSLAFIGLSYPGPWNQIPDPEPRSDRNYQVLDVKVLNVAQTNANDNYIPYRQAQFFANRSDPGKDSFIDEWGVHFFQRTPLMGAVTAQFFNALNDKPPVDYIWSSNASDPHHTFIKFQIIAHTLNCLFVVPAFYLLALLFNRRASQVALLFMIPSQFFLYNAFFSWPKSFVAFFVLLTWLLLIQRSFSTLLLASIASGMAYLAHDLAVLYLGASVLLLMFQKRFRDMFVFGAINILFMVPWILTSVLLYKKPSSFALYPLSLHDIPQLDKKKEIISEFLHTSPLRIVAIKLESLFYLASPYQLIYAEAGQTFLRRLWALGIISIPGSLGIGMIIPAFIGIIKKFRSITLWLMAGVPLLLSTIVIGWPKGLGSLHFAQAIIVILTGLGAWYLTRVHALWALLAYIISTIQFVLFVLFSYSFHEESWINAGDLLRLSFISLTIITCGMGIYVLVYTSPKTAIKYRLFRSPR